MKITNLLEFPVNIVDEDGAIATLPPNAMDVLPNEQPGVYYLTTKQAAQKVGRADVVTSAELQNLLNKVSKN